jgi:hypothetical protein
MTARKVEDRFKVLTVLGDSPEEIALKLNRLSAQGWYPIMPLHRGYDILLERGCPDNIKVEND